MCDKRIASLKKLALKPPRPVQEVTPEPAVPLQPPGGAPHLLRRKQNKVSLKWTQIPWNWTYCSWFFPNVYSLFAAACQLTTCKGKTIRLWTRSVFNAKAFAFSKRAKSKRSPITQWHRRGAWCCLLWLLYNFPSGLFKTYFKFIVQNSHVALLSGQEIEAASWEAQVASKPKYKGRPAGWLAVIRQFPATSFTFAG